MKSDNFNINGPSFEIEAGLFNENKKIIAGVDEAGRGALAGPLSVGLVIYNTDYFSNPHEFFSLIKDSKKISPKKRDRVADIIKEKALYHDNELVSVEKIDDVNINRATEYAINLLIDRCPLAIDALIIDGNFKFKTTVPIYSFIKGDNRSYSISSASIIAKTTRDSLMVDYHKEYPDYGFDSHKGYGTALHRTKIRELGGTPIHRKTYDPLKSMLISEKNGTLFNV